MFHSTLGPLLGNAIGLDRDYIKQQCSQLSCNYTLILPSLTDLG